MIKEKIKMFFENSREVFRKIGIGILLCLTMVGAFVGGFIYRKETTPKPITIEMVKVDKAKVNLALDENNHLIVIEKATGNYTIYDDSIGVAIFKLYARNIKMTE
jgi:hypothetical protein